MWPLQQMRCPALDFPMSDARLQGWRLARVSSARVRARVGWHNALSGKAVSFRLARSSAPSRSRSRTASRRLSSIATIFRKSARDSERR